MYTTSHNLSGVSACDAIRPLLGTALKLRAVRAKIPRQFQNVLWEL
jgi:hypothetical protein